MTDYTSNTITIPLSKRGKYAGKYKSVVDEQDGDLAELNWHVHLRKAYQYARRSDRGAKEKENVFFLHRIILERKLGRKLKDTEFTHHINSDRLDNRRENLCVATKSEIQYAKRKQSNNKSGLRGVLQTTWGKYLAQIYANRKHIHLGVFETAEEAHEAYCEAAKELHGEFANTMNHHPTKGD